MKTLCPTWTIFYGRREMGKTTFEWQCRWPGDQIIFWDAWKRPQAVLVFPRWSDISSRYWMTFGCILRRNRPKIDLWGSISCFLLRDTLKNRTALFSIPTKLLCVAKFSESRLKEAKCWLGKKSTSYYRPNCRFLVTQRGDHDNSGGILYSTWR